MNTKQILAAVVALTAASCSTSRYYDARYQPAPLEVEVAANTAARSQVRALVSVLGVTRPNEKENLPCQVEVRLRLENLGSVDARVVEDGFSLVSADLVPFDRAVLAPNSDLSVPVGETRTIDVAFASPEKKLDWSGLNLRFTVTFGGTRVTTGGTFTQSIWVSDPVHWHVGFGYSTGW